MLFRRPLRLLMLGLLLAAALAGAAAASGVVPSSVSSSEATFTAARDTRSPQRLATEATASKLSLVAEPAAGRKPFLQLIAGARHSVELTMYELYDRSMERALAAAARRGVEVRVLLNGGYYGDGEFKDSAHNGPAYSYLRSHRVHVRWTSSRYALTHQKTLTVDGRVSAIMTLNFDGEYASTRDFAVLDRRRADVRAVVGAFDADWNGRGLKAADGSGDLIWSPGAAPALEALIKGARRSLDVEDEEMDYAPVTDELCAAARSAVNVRVVMTYDSSWKTAFAKLRGCGVHVRLFHGQAYYIHAKILIADGDRAIVSSQNFSYTSLYENRELGIRLHAAAVVKRLTAAFDSDYRDGSAS